MVPLLETQAFNQFIFERIVREQNDYEVLFFDEILKLKKNRSRFIITKEATPFIDVCLLIYLFVDLGGP